MDGLAFEQCACGMWIVLKLDQHNTPIAWGSIPDPEDSETWNSPEWLEMCAVRIRDQLRVEREVFMPITICTCGRRFRALDRPPWIEPIELPGETPRQKKKVHPLDMDLGDVFGEPIEGKSDPDHLLDLIERGVVTGEYARRLRKRAEKELRDKKVEEDGGS